MTKRIVTDPPRTVDSEEPEEAKIEPEPKVVEPPAKAKYYEKLFRGGK